MSVKFKLFITGNKNSNRTAEAHTYLMRKASA